MNKKRTEGNCLFLLPGMLGLVTFYLIPLGVVMWLSFSDGSGINLRHYKHVLKSEAFQLALKNTFLLFLSGIPAILVAGLGFALALKRLFQWNPAASRMVFLMHLLPMVLPSAVVTLAVEALVPYRRGIPAAILMTALYIWRNTPYMLLAVFWGLRKLPEDIQNAAMLDGASVPQQLRYIILPFLKPYLLVGIVLALLGVSRIFRESFLLFGSYPDRTVYYIQNYMNNLFRSLQYGPLAAVSDLFLLGSSVWLLAVLRLLGKGAER